MKISARVILLGIVIVSFVTTIFYYPILPMQIPMHWNIHGTIDSYMQKNVGAFLLPILMLLMLVTFQLIPSFDPNKKKYQLFEHEWNIIQTGFLLFFLSVQYIVLYAAMHPKTNIMPYMFGGLGILFVLLGNYMSKIRQNYFIGVKTPWSLADEDNWNKTHRFASWCFVGAGLLTLTEAIVLWLPAFIIFIGIIIASFLPILYSFLLYQKKGHYMKYIYVIGALTIGGAMLLRLSTPEDGWVCQKGQWIPHGKPYSTRPNKPCTNLRP